MPKISIHILILWITILNITSTCQAGSFNKQQSKSMFSVNKEEIKKINEQYLINHGARICEWLPFTDNISIIRTQDEIVYRASILQAMFSLYLGAPTFVIKKWLDDNDLLSYLSPKELSLLNKHEKDITDQEMNYLSWNIESLYTLLWVGGIYRDLPLQNHVPDDLVKFLPDIKANDSIEKFKKSLKLRSFEEIYQTLDLYYRAHWYTRDCYIKGEDAGNFDLPVIEYRRHALEWLFDEVNWDDIDLST